MSQNRFRIFAVSLTAIYMFSILAYGTAVSQDREFIDVSGKWWITVNGMEIEVKQNGNQATWFVPAFNQRGIGTIEGQTFSVSWQETAGEQALTGQIVQVTHNGVALRIELSNGLILSRIPPLYHNIIDSTGYYIYKIMLILLCLM